MTQHNQFLDGVFSEATSLTHLPDTNGEEHYNEAQIIKHSAYYGETEFSKLLNKKAGLTILSVNMQCVNTKFDDLQSFINRVNLTNPISVICLQECWLKDTDNVSMFNLTDYNLVSLPKTCYGHGGLMIYVHNQFQCTTINHKILKKATDWEYLCVEISHQKHNLKKYIIFNIYRKPGEILDEFNVFLAEFTSFLTYIKNQNRPSYLCGDYNIDLLKIKMKNHFNDYFDELVTNGFFPKITLPTRIGERSSSLIDNIFTNDTEEKETAGILLNHLSDHQIIFTYIEKLIVNQVLHTGIFPRQLKLSRVKPIYKSGEQTVSAIIDQFPCYRQCLRYLNMLYLIN